jgi:hypothetical protein
MKIGTKTHYCNGSREVGTKIFGRIVNLYIHREGKWVKMGTICTNCGDHWIKDVAYRVPRSRSTKLGKS